MPKPRRYYTLVSSVSPGPWAVEFGDYSRAVVVQERDDMLDALDRDCNAPKVTLFRILTTDDSQAEIDSAVAALNAKARS